MLYGRNGALEALQGRRTLKTLFLAEGIKSDDRVRHLSHLAAQAGAAIVTVPRAELDRWTGGANHQGVGLETGTYPYVPLDELLAPHGTILMLDHLQDPQNFGTLLRAAEAVGVAGVVLPRDRAVEVTPSVVNASSGAVEHLRIAQTPNLARAIEEFKKGGWWAAALDTGEDAQDIFQATIPTPLVLVVGAEGGGVSANLRRHCDLIISIPMTGRVASLNAATAGSVALFEILRRERTEA